MAGIIDIFDNTVTRFADRLSFCDETEEYTWAETDRLSDRIAHYLIKKGIKHRPILLLYDRMARCPISMIGVLKAADFYVVLDCHQPVDRMKEITDTLDSPVIITDIDNKQTAEELGIADVLLWEAVKEGEGNIQASLIDEVTDSIVDTDLAYVLYTSGSTGAPKGVALTHANVVSYSKWYADTFDLNETFVCGGQTPFYFSMSVSDVYGCIRTGACLQTIPKRLFGFPVQLLQYMIDKKVDSIYWVPAALGVVAAWDGLTYVKPDLKHILFAGENMPVPKLNYWRKFYPDAVFANLFGPTETTDICVYYVVNRDFDDADMLPIGRPCRNCGILVLDEEGREVADGEEGEMYAYGSFIAAGYYNFPEKTAERFVQNPLNKALPQILYRTGDIVKKNEFGELMFCGRRDHQIKHLGYRIELGEIEAAAGAAAGVQECAALYDEAADKISLVYSGKKCDDAVLEVLKQKLPSYMIPSEITRIMVMPHNANGKIDRKELAKL